jgi:hypothetical protein
MSGPGENDKAGLIAAHLEAAGDASEAFGWFMRAGSWFTNRDITAARTSWRHARDLADGMCDEEPYREWMRIAPRALLCGSAWRAGGSVADAGFEELRRLCGDPEYRVPLAFGMAGQISQLTVHARVWEAARLADEYVGLLDAIGDPMLMLGLLYPAVHAEHEACAMARTRELAERVVVLSEGDPARGNILTGSPLAFATMMCASADCALGQSNWRRGIDQAIEYSRIDPTTYVTMVMFKYVLGITYGALVADDAAVAATADALEVAQRCSEDFALHSAQLARGIVLVSARHGADRSVALELLDRAREAALADRFMLTAMPLIEMQFASEHARAGRLDEAVELARRVIAEQRRTGALLHLGASTMTLVDCLLDRRGPSDSTAARSALEALESMPAEPGFVLYELAVLRIRAQLARMEGDDEFVACLRRYASRAGALEFDGHIAAAEVLAAQHRK